MTGMPVLNHPGRLSAAVCAAGLALTQLAACASVHPQKAPAPPAGDSTALTVSAEVALKRGDCRTASEDYAQAAASGDAALARRAGQVAIACEHVPAAWQAANRWRTLAEVPAETAESRALSRELRARGFTFVGPTICYAFMQAVGVVNDHLVSCFRYKEVGAPKGSGN